MSGYSGKSVRRKLDVPVRQSPASVAATNSNVPRPGLAGSGQLSAGQYTKDALNQAGSEASNFPLNSRAQISDGLVDGVRTLDQCVMIASNNYVVRPPQARREGRA